MKSRRALWIGLAACFVVLFQLIHLYGLHDSKDLPLWDEATYLGWGDSYLSTGYLKSVTNSPPYQALYGLLIAGFGLVDSFYAMQYLMKIVVSLLVFLTAAHLSRSTLFGLVFALFFAYSAFHVHAEVLVYYGALAPLLGAVLTIKRWPLLGLGLAVLSALGRLENAAIASVAIGILAIDAYLSRRAPNDSPPSPGGSWSGWTATAAVWLVNGYLLSRITVWELHNRVWFAWSQNFAYFRVATGQIEGVNPWLEHTTITQSEFPGADSLSDAWARNPSAVLEHTWFNLAEIPGNLAEYIRPLSDAFAISILPALVWLSIIAGGLMWAFADSSYLMAVRFRLRERWREVALCLAGAAAAAPALIVTTRTPYITSLLPIAILAPAVFWHPDALKTTGRKLANAALVAITLFFAASSLLAPRAYPPTESKPPIRDNVERVRSALADHSELTILGVSAASYISYLGASSRHRFVSIHAISPIVDEQSDRNLKTLIESNDPDAILVDGDWMSDPSLVNSMEDYSLSDWVAVPLRDGTLYLKPGLKLSPQFKGPWHGPETNEQSSWRWAQDDARIQFSNSIPNRMAIVRFTLQPYGDRDLSVSFGDRILIDQPVSSGALIEVGPVVLELTVGTNTITIRTDNPPEAPATNDNRLLAYRVIDLKVEEVKEPKAASPD